MTEEPTAPQLTWPDLLGLIADQRDLTAEQTAWAMRQVMTGHASPAVLGGMLLGLAAKGETTAELAGIAEEMLAHAEPFRADGTGAVDVVGTGGDRMNTVNVSTMASLVVAGAGLGVVKHGNRAASSTSGSADVLEALGVSLDLPAARVAEVYQRAGITFCFAMVFHPSFRHAGPVRKELGIGTIFNLLGPLTNPGRPRAAAIGVARHRALPLVAGVLARRGTSALVFRGRNGLDELSATAVNDVIEVREGKLEAHSLDAVADLGLRATTVDELRGSDAGANADIARRVLHGEGAGSPTALTPIRETVLLNAAAALVAHGTLPGTGAGHGDLTARLRAGLALAAEAVDSGAAQARLEAWVTATQD